MTKLGTVEKDPVLVPEGTYKAFPSVISHDQGKWGPTVIIEFTLVTDDMFDGEKIKGIARQAINNSTKLGQWIKAITGKIPGIGEEVNEEDILNRYCRLVIVHTKKENGNFPKIEKILPFEEENTKENTENQIHKENKEEDDEFLF